MVSKGISVIFNDGVGINSKESHPLLSSQVGMTLISGVQPWGFYTNYQHDCSTSHWPLLKRGTAVDYRHWLIL